MNFLGIGPGELVFILLIALVMFGPRRLPEIGRDLGRAISEFRRATEGLSAELAKGLDEAAEEERKAKERAAGPKPEPIVSKPAAPEVAVEVMVAPVAASEPAAIVQSSPTLEPVAPSAGTEGEATPQLAAEPPHAVDQSATPSSPGQESAPSPNVAQVGAVSDPYARPWENTDVFK